MASPSNQNELDLESVDEEPIVGVDDQLVLAQ